MNKIKLSFKGISEIVGTEEVGLLILSDEQEQRQLSVTCDKFMLREFRLRISQAPIVNGMLPEVLWQLLNNVSQPHFEITINDIIEGQYRAVIFDTETLEHVSVRASDAVLFSYISKIPLFIEERLMLKQSVEYHKESRGMSIPVNTLSDDMISKALEKAISDENYELASHLRDEIKRREILRRPE